MKQHLAGHLALTNGSVSREALEEMADLSLESGGCIKFDLKAWDEPLHKALCGVSNRVTLKNFEYLSRWITRRPDPPFLVASTLLSSYESLSPNCPGAVRGED